MYTNSSMEPALSICPCFGGRSPFFIVSVCHKHYIDFHGKNEQRHWADIKHIITAWSNHIRSDNDS